MYHFNVINHQNHQTTTPIHKQLYSKLGSDRLSTRVGTRIQPDGTNSTYFLSLFDKSLSLNPLQACHRYCIYFEILSECNCSHPMYTDYLDNFAATTADMCHFMPAPATSAGGSAAAEQYACVANVTHHLDLGLVGCLTCQPSCACVIRLVES